jgi:hypothetical protein
VTPYAEFIADRLALVLQTIPPRKTRCVNASRLTLCIISCPPCPTLLSRLTKTIGASLPSGERTCATHHCACLRDLPRRQLAYRPSPLPATRQNTPLCCFCTARHGAYEILEVNTTLHWPPQAGLVGASYLRRLVLRACPAGGL